MAKQSRANTPATSKLPLAVDMDGTLVRSDLLLEALMNVAKGNIFYLIGCLFTYLRHGLAAFKTKIFTRAQFDLKHLPYNLELIEHIKTEKARGRRIVLATASSQNIAQAVADHLGLFDQVIASSATVNLSGYAKAERLTELFGDKGFAYAGNAWVDMKVWRVAGAAIVVNAPAGLVLAAEQIGPVEAVLPRAKATWRLVLKAMRLHQWPKNILIFAPLVLAHKVLYWDLLTRAMVGTIAFTLMSSSVYVLNDLLDLDSDRRHPDNRRRPFASGALSLGWGIALAPALLAAGSAVASLVSIPFLGVLLGYYLVTLAYSLRLKQLVLADTLILASLYTWRIFAGSFAVDVPISAWFLTFSCFFFLSLALIKRCAELILMAKQDLPPNPRRGYWISDLSQLTSLGSAAGYISVLVLALYINNDQVARLYQRPMVMWLVCPFILYWISRMWLIAHRGGMTSDPLVFALKDRVSYVILVFVGVIWAVASGVV